MNRADALIVTNLIAGMVLASQVFLIVFILLFLLSNIYKKNKSLEDIFSFFSQNALAFAFLVALGASGGSLFFSDVAGFLPCKLCWYQRIFLYPQAVILGIAALKNDFGIKKYALALSIVGSAIAIYHYILQMSPLPLPCTDEVVSCTQKQVVYFGYITIPLMSLTAFLLIIFFMLQIRQGKK